MVAHTTPDFTTSNVVSASLTEATKAHLSIVGGFWGGVACDVGFASGLGAVRLSATGVAELAVALGLLCAVCSELWMTGNVKVGTLGASTAINT